MLHPRRVLFPKARFRALFGGDGSLAAAWRQHFCGSLCSFASCGHGSRIGFLLLPTLVEPYVVSVVVTRSAAAAQKYGITFVCLFLVSFSGVLSAFLAGHFHGTLVGNRFLEPALSSIGHVLGLRIRGAAHGAS